MHEHAGRRAECDERPGGEQLSYSHKSLTSINGENLKKDLLDCKNIIENVTKGKIYSISYPYGSNQDFNQEVFDVCKNIGLKYYIPQN